MHEPRPEDYIFATIIFGRARKSTVRMATSVDAKLLRATKFPPEFNQKVDMQKVNVEVMKKWIASKIAEILGNEDDVVIELCFNLVEGERFVRQTRADDCSIC
jgi:hypothetical protein